MNVIIKYYAKKTNNKGPSFAFKLLSPAGKEY